MINKTTTFLNIIVKYIKFDGIQKFIESWMNQECKDFKIVFIYDGIDDFDCFNTDETKAINYVKQFVDSIKHSEMIEIVKTGKDIPASQFTIVFNDISRLPIDKFEIQNFKKSCIEEKNILKKEKKPHDIIHITESKNVLNCANVVNDKKHLDDCQKNIEKHNNIIQIVESKKIINSINAVNDKKYLDNCQKISEKHNVKDENRSNAKKTDCKNKIVCYTCITRGYDNILDPYVKPSGIDFICFSDREIKSNIWQWRKIPDELMNLDSIRQQRILKICPHRWFKEYDISIWIDGNIQIKDDLNQFIKQYNIKQCSFWVRKHPKRDCIYDEARECIALKKGPKDIIQKQMAKYRAIKYPEHNKLAETGIILRNHNDLACQRMCDVWAAEIITESFRDQLSFNYACYATKFRYNEMIYDAVIIDDKNRYFNWNKTHAKKYDNISSIDKNNYITIAICNFNTTQMTCNCIQSIYKNSRLKNIKIIVLDNSYAQHKFQIPNKMNQLGIQVLDNTNGKIINFNNALKTMSNITIKTNNNGSFKHCLSIQFLIDFCKTQDLLIFDSDTLLLKPIDFIDHKYITVADLEIKNKKNPRNGGKIYRSETRFLPFIQYINCQMIKDNKIKYFYPDRIHGGLTVAGNYYDTGASLYEDVLNLNLPFKQISYKNYIQHFEHGSWKNSKIL